MERDKKHSFLPWEFCALGRADYSAVCTEKKDSKGSPVKKITDLCRVAKILASLKLSWNMCGLTSCLVSVNRDCGLLSIIQQLSLQ